MSAPDIYATSNELVQLELGCAEYLATLLELPPDFWDGGEVGDPYVKVSIEQVWWLAHLPVEEEDGPEVLSKFFAAEVYEAIIGAGQQAFIPLDSRTAVLGGS